MRGRAGPLGEMGLVFAPGWQRGVRAQRAGGLPHGKPRSPFYPQYDSKLSGLKKPPPLQPSKEAW